MKKILWTVLVLTPFFLLTNARAQEGVRNWKGGLGLTASGGVAYPRFFGFSESFKSGYGGGIEMEAFASGGSIGCNLNYDSFMPKNINDSLNGPNRNLGVISYGIFLKMFYSVRAKSVLNAKFGLTGSTPVEVRGDHQTIIGMNFGLGAMYMVSKKAMLGAEATLHNFGMIAFYDRDFAEGMMHPVYVTVNAKLTFLVWQEKRTK